MPTRIIYIDNKRQNVEIWREGGVWIVTGVYFGRSIEARARSEERALRRWYEAAGHRLAQVRTESIAGRARAGRFAPEDFIDPQ